jgi:hypothetical protein
MAQACSEEVLEALLAQARRAQAASGPGPPQHAQQPSPGGLLCKKQAGGEDAACGEDGGDGAIAEAAVAEEVEPCTNSCLHAGAEPLLQRLCAFRLRALMAAHGTALRRCRACGGLFSEAAAPRLQCGAARAGALQEG